MADAARVIWHPSPGPQTLLLACPIPEVFFGGARGGGKTSGMLGDYLSHEAEFGEAVRGGWFRRTYPELGEAKGQAKELFPQLGAEWKESTQTWTFPSGAEFWFRYLENDADADKYQGQAFSWLGFDEAGTWASPVAIDKLRGSLRSSKGVRTRMVLTGNPGGVGHSWLKARYIEPAPPLTPIEVDLGDGDKALRVYIPSKLSNNPYLRNDSTYVANLKMSGAPWVIKAWLGGDWDAQIEGNVFKLAWFQRYRIPPTSYDLVIQSWDTAVSKSATAAWTVCITAGIIGRNLYVLDVYRERVEYPDLKRRHRNMAARTTWDTCPFPVQPPNTCVVEFKSSGQQLVQEARTPDPEEPEHLRFPASCALVEMDPGTDNDKLVRAVVETPAVEGRQVWLPERAAWLPIFEDETGTFPESAFKDQVDALSQLLRYVRERFWGGAFQYQATVGGKDIVQASNLRPDAEPTVTDIAVAEREARLAERKHKSDDEIQAESLWGALPGWRGRDE